MKGGNGHFRNIVDALPLGWENVCVCVCVCGGVTSFPRRFSLALEVVREKALASASHMTTMGGGGSGGSGLLRL